MHMYGEKKTVDKTRVTPVAVIGMACRLPGGIDSPDLLWEALLRGDDLVTEVPPDRWDIDEYYDPEPGVPGRSICKWGAFMDNIADFDPEFFGIPEQEAIAMDPQHRLLLETSWEAMEHAGLTPQKMADSLTGVFIGLNHGDYQFAARRRGYLRGAVRQYRHQFLHGVRARLLRPGAARSRGHSRHRVLVRSVCCAPGLPQPQRRRKRPCLRRRRLRDAGTPQVRLGVGVGHVVCDRTLPCV